MPGYTYPGVYIQESPGSAHPITGVATSIAAFVGWAARGPTNQATLVESWVDFQAHYGGLDSRSLLGYAVNQFFANGGSQAFVVRLAAANAATASTPNAAMIGNRTVYAKNSGAWGNNIAITAAVSSADNTRFSILVQSTAGASPQSLENFVDLSFSSSDPQGRYVVDIIDSESNYITFIQPGTTTPPAPPTGPLPGYSLKNLSGGLDGTVLTPNTNAFETALSAVGVGVNLLGTVFFNILCVPGETTASVVSTLQKFCADNRAFYIVDSDQSATYSTLNTNGPAGMTTAPNAANAAFYFPWISAPDPLASGQPRLFPPCGFVAGVYAATDASRGVWKAPAGINAELSGVLGLQYCLTDQQSGDLNRQAINCLRQFPVNGDVVWGSRTLLGNDQVGSQWKYVPIRRFALFLESCLYEGTQWAVFEPNDETLWGQLRMNIGAFMQGLFLKGAFQGASPQQAYFVKCDSENNTQANIDLGIVNVTVGFAPLYPAEFVVIQIQQMARQL